MSSLDYLVAGRMHACIAAFSSGTPVMPVAYSRKFSGLFGTLGYDFLLPVRGMDTQAALDFLMEGLGKRRSEEHTSELQSLMRISYAVFCLKKKTQEKTNSLQQYCINHH